MRDAIALMTEAAEELDAYYAQEHAGDHPHSVTKLAQAKEANPARAALTALQEQPAPVARLLLLGDGQAVKVGGARFDGWLFRQHPDGHYVSVRKLDVAPPPEHPAWQHVSDDLEAMALDKNPAAFQPSPAREEGRDYGKTMQPPADATHCGGYPVNSPRLQESPAPVGVKSGIVEKLRARLVSASINERRYERPMTWEEADELLSALQPSPAKPRAAEARATAAEADAAAARTRVRELEERLRDILLSLNAATSLLSRSPKTAAPSDKMFDKMLADYEASAERAHRALTRAET
jgi:hypothetical protein